MEIARCMMFEKKIPKFMWAEAINAFVYLLNRLPIGYVYAKTPYEMWIGFKHSVKPLKVFGSVC